MRTSFAIACFGLASTGCFAPTDAETPLPGPRADGAVIAQDGGTERIAISTRLLSIDASTLSPWLVDPALLKHWLADEVRLGEVGGEFAIEWPSAGKRWVGRLVALDPQRGFVAELDGVLPNRAVRFELSHASVAGGERVEFRMGPFGAEMADEVLASGYRSGLAIALSILERAVAGEAVSPECPAAVERVFHPLESPSEGLEAELKMKNPPLRKP